jgi:4-hydroxyphenylacetate 3-monooxygenase
VSCRGLQARRTFGQIGVIGTPVSHRRNRPRRTRSGRRGRTVERYLQSATLDGPERLRLFRLAWDTCLSAFAGRHSLYEYFFFGDPVRMAGAVVATYDCEPCKQRVRDFLVRD